MRRSFIITTTILALAAAASAHADDLKIALIYGKTGPLEAYGKQTETGFMMGLEYATGGTMTVDGRKIVVIEKDDQGKPDLGKAAARRSLRRRQGRHRGRPDRRRACALAMLPVAEEYKKILLVEPAVADSITGDKWNRYIFRTGRNCRRTRSRNAVAIDKQGVTDRHAGAGLRLRPRRREGVQGGARKTGARSSHEEYAAASDHRLHRRRASACSTR